ncbi:hypothetical protein [Natrarchaeobaculum sulfurireducens]|uniref:hypothetical protein n=1 Tax=Natrarchaeobaculum sulfurireducens TaxID=2044521 RepID=UPI00105AB0EC|nr:hypothetical protein [Natrarchaeobaculum sulfurireducens]
MSNELYSETPHEAIELYLENNSNFKKVDNWEREEDSQFTLDEFEEKLENTFDGELDRSSIEGVKSVFLIRYRLFNSDGEFIGFATFSAIPHQSDHWEVAIWESGV